MHASPITGLYGKLPAHGDFVVRNLPSSFVSSWDQWLQHFVISARDNIGENWLDIYLTSPLWRFVLSPGVIDSSVWAGVMMPSVDRVGRYFPFSIALKLEGDNNPFEFLSLRSGWFSEIEELALSALHGKITLDELSVLLEECTLTIDSSYKRAARVHGAKILYGEVELEEQSPSSTYPQFLDYCLSESLNSYSVWATDGSERVFPCVFITHNLPSPEKIPAMLDGKWKQRGYHQPYELKLEQPIPSPE